VASKQVSGILIVSAATILSGILLYLWPQMRLVELRYRQNALQTQRTQALQRQKELQIELSTLRQLPRIEAIAVQRLGMRPPQMSQIIYVRPEQHAASARREP
jgi:cell division protein FtsL